MNICLRIVTERIQPGDELALFCQLRMAVVCTGHRAENHDVVQFLRDGQEGYLYVDKTAYLHSFVRQEGNMCFLSRPRRFGKTLTVSTLEAVFQGRRKLFKGLP